MSDNLETTPEIESILTKYIQRRADLENELKSIEQDLASRLGARNKVTVEFKAFGKKYRADIEKRSEVEYDEDLLRQRLEDRYEAILKPDIDKIARVLNDIEACFDHVLSVVGTPSPDKVKEAIEEGLVDKEEFDGAFRKTTRPFVTITESM